MPNTKSTNAKRSALPPRTGRLPLLPTSKQLKTMYEPEEADPIELLDSSRDEFVGADRSYRENLSKLLAIAYTAFLQIIADDSHQQMLFEKAMKTGVRAKFAELRHEHRILTLTMQYALRGLHSFSRADDFARAIDVLHLLGVPDQEMEAVLKRNNVEDLITAARFALPRRKLGLDDIENTRQAFRREQLESAFDCEVILTRLIEHARKGDEAEIPHHPVKRDEPGEPDFEARNSGKPSTVRKKPNAVTPAGAKARPSRGYEHILLESNEIDEMMAGKFQGIQIYAEKVGVSKDGYVKLRVDYWQHFE